MARQLGRLIVKDSAIKATRLILLTSAGHRDDGRVAADIGFAGYLLKPITQRDLTDCLLLALASTPESWHLNSQPIITRQSLRALRPTVGARILLAEDNVVNQKVAMRLLEQAGHSIEVAADGIAAVAAWKRARFDLIFMDCQMPHMGRFRGNARDSAAGACRESYTDRRAHRQCHEVRRR